MKLGEALSTRADLQARISQLAERLRASAVVQEGDTPPEDPAKLLGELDDMCARLAALVAAVNATNTVRQLDAGSLRRTVDELARERRELDTAIQEVNWTTELVEDASR